MRTVDNEGARLLRSAMKGRGLTQRAVSLLLKIPEERISRWVNAARIPGRVAAGRLERTFGIPLASWDEPAMPDAAESGDLATKDEPGQGVA